MVKFPQSRDGENHVEVLKYGVRKRKKRVKEEEKRDERESCSIAAAQLESVAAWEEEAWRLSSGVVDEPDVLGVVVVSLLGRGVHG